ncbi:MAG: hypothetical protein SYNGOMJ08_00217 [Candidatus Syntrophoarchaeum sp. GoM_oil]|nr:MAG: hypothetical protein SYNGOMJ08_00217 [Candidatus Syntrophoarchaeum sp. GoM_oil]
MSTTINLEYFGDLFDWEELGEWFLAVDLNAKKIKDHPIVLDRSFDRHMQVVLGMKKLDLLVEIKDQKVDLDPVEVLHKKCTESTYHLPVFVAREFSVRAENYANNHGVIAINADEIARILGQDPPKFSEGQAVGMIVGIKLEYLEKLLEKGTPAIYIKGGPVGKYLEKGHILAFYLTSPDKKIAALGKVSSTKIGSPSEIWESHGDMMAFSKDEFFRFSKMKRNILAIELSEIWGITSIEEKELDEFVPQKDRVGSYIDQSVRDRIVDRS